MAALFGIILLAGIWSFSSADNCLKDYNVSTLAEEIPKLFQYLETFQDAANPGFVPASTGLDTAEKARSDGYPAETHNITTEDGYILTYHRIPHGKTNTNMTNRPVVFLQHGLFSESTHWVIQNAGTVLAYILADLGFDVWLGNCRGNRYSRGHKKYTTRDPKFWKTGWTEMGEYDIPAAIDYILNKTGREKLSYLGHSMGTTMYFVMCSERPEHCAKVNYMVAFGPVAYMTNVISPARLLAPVLGQPSAQTPLIAAGQGEFFPKTITNIIGDFGPSFCNSDLRASISCSVVLFLIMGFDYCQLNPDLIPLIIPTLSSCPTQSMVQYLQEMNCPANEPCFQKVDYGLFLNYFAYYGEFSPPRFNFTNINTPKTLFVGPNDLLATPKDNENFHGLMPNTNMTLVNYKLFSHLDFLFATDARELLYDQAINLLLSANGMPLL